MVKPQQAGAVGEVRAHAAQVHHPRHARLPNGLGVGSGNVARSGHKVERRVEEIERRQHAVNGLGPGKGASQKRQVFDRPNGGCGS